MIYVDPPFYTNRIFNKNGCQFNDKWKNTEDYLDWFEPRLIEFKRILNKSGTIYFHCDWHISHYLKILADEKFGMNNFINEIVWKRQSSHNDSKQGSKNFGRIHDVILVYGKTRKYTWNQQYSPYEKEYIKNTYKYTEEGTNRKYALSDLTGPGGEMKGNPRYEFLGFTKYWRYNKEKMFQLFINGRIVYKEGKLPRMKRYLDEMQGKPLQDLWLDIGPETNIKYPTQKPIQLLERIILTSTNANQLVYDPFAGSCTSGIASFNLSRSWIGSELSLNACKHSLEKLKFIE
jgi:adenine specific DNA methylase Mod